MELVLIAAVAENNVIGVNGELPWHYTEDLKRFKDLTMGHPVLMGRKTYESIPERYRPLAGRLNMVLSRLKDSFDDGSYVCNSLELALDMLRDENPHLQVIDYSLAFVIGGAHVYERAMPYATRLEITHVHKSYEGDVFFPEIDSRAWVEKTRVDKTEYSFVTYERK